MLRPESRSDERRLHESAQLFISHKVAVMAFRQSRCRHSKRAKSTTQVVNFNHPWQTAMHPPNPALDAEFRAILIDPRFKL